MLYLNSVKLLGEAVDMALNVSLTVGAKDLEDSGHFYDAVLATIGWGLHTAFPGWRGYSEAARGEGVVFWVCTPYNGAEATAGNGTMIGFSAKTNAEVDAFHAAALKAGGSSEGSPGPRPDYGPEWYAAYVRDPTGNKILIVCKTWPE
jgi:catechol 2,3-dioxygenase-like lactoylglutathione lyase family enzyme